MPTLCAGLGFTTTIEAQLLTVPGGSSRKDRRAFRNIAHIIVYAIAALTFVTAGILSDKYMRRYPFMMFGLTCNLVGYIILCTAPQVGVRYAGIFIASMGLYIPTALNNLWAADNHGGHFKRATTCGTIVFVGSELHEVDGIDGRY
jgi:MFS family permease